MLKNIHFIPVWKILESAQFIRASSTFVSSYIKILFFVSFINFPLFLRKNLLNVKNVSSMLRNKHFLSLFLRFSVVNLPFKNFSLSLSSFFCSFNAAVLLHKQYFIIFFNFFPLLSLPLSSSSGFLFLEKR